MKPILVGEQNPWGSNPMYALWPDPPGCAGWRLCHVVLGLTPDDYLARYERTNLLAGHRWSVPRARRAAADLCAKRIPAGRIAILLGTRVCQAFGLPYDPFTIVGGPHSGPIFVRLPHPSGRCRAWGDERAVERARAAVRAASFGQPEGKP